MRNAAREAALNIIFCQHFNNDCIDKLKKKVFKQFALEKAEDIEFAEALIRTVETHRAELIIDIEKACHHYLENRINPT